MLYHLHFQGGYAFATKLDSESIFSDVAKGIIRDGGELIEMLIRMGVVGKLIGNSNDYDKFRLDYTYNGAMPYSVDDQFGVHPAFSGQFRGGTNAIEPYGLPRQIYPIEVFSGERQGTGPLQV